MKIFSPVQQEYIYLNSGDEVIVFSGYNDTVNFKCGIVNIPESKQIAAGLNKLTIPKGCYARSRELVIYSHSKVVNKGLMPNVNKLDFTKNIDELSGLVEAVNDMNFSRGIDELTELGDDIKHMSLNLASIGQSLVEFRKIKSLTGYHPLNISFTDQLALTNVVSYSGATVTFLIFLLICYLFYRCATCCSPVYGLLKCIFGGIFGAFKNLLDFCKKIRVAKDDIDRTTGSRDDFPMESTRSPNSIVWEIECVGSRLILYVELQSVIFTTKRN
jgi:hypothetical protein